MRATLALHGYSDGLSARKLDLRKRCLGLRAVAHVCTCLATRGCQVHVLDVSDNNLRGTAAETLCEAMASNTSLDTLILSQNLLSARAIRCLATSLSAARHSASKIRELELCNVGIGNLPEDAIRAVADMVSKSPHLRVLDLSGNALRNMHAQTIAAALVASYSSRRPPSSEAHVDDRRGCLGCLRLLRLCRNKIGHYGVSALGHAFAHAESELGALDISHNPLGSVGAAFLAEPLKTSTRLHTLIANACQLGYKLSTDDGDIRKGQMANSIPVLDGRGLLALFQALRYNTTLVALSVRDNWCGGGDHALVMRTPSRETKSRAAAAHAGIPAEARDAVAEAPADVLHLHDRLANAIARQMGTTTLTHLDIGLLGLGARGVLAIANALIKGSGADDIERVRARHHAALDVFERHTRDTEIELVQRREKLALVEAFVEARREKGVHRNERAQKKRYAMTADLKRKAGRKTVSDAILKERLAVADAAKAAYAHRALSAEQQHNLELAKLERRLVTPDV